ncbi:MAG: lipid-A-disaccharide synthase N-terminal domain-containing protein [Planctomycetes bacterium]|nr:lipid-A-disaccharide synthase N-terminal domain-containing protein [Planctomycetota bacterium]
MLDSIIEFIRSAFTEQIVNDPIWATVALIGQLVFGGRFVLQWLVSEYKKKSHVPTAFWFMSLAGSLILLSYSIHIKNPIFTLGFSLNTLIYLRNIHLIHLHAKKGVITAIEEGED